LSDGTVRDKIWQCETTGCQEMGQDLSSHWIQPIYPLQLETGQGGTATCQEPPWVSDGEDHTLPASGPQPLSCHTPVGLCDFTGNVLLLGVLFLFRSNNSLQ
jgi:hypothetical protein